MALYTESTLSDSYIYSVFDNNKTISARIASLLKSGVRVTPQMIESQLLQIRSTRISPMWETVLDEYEEGNILLLYDKTINIPDSIPFVVIKLQGSYKSIVILNRLGILNKDQSVFNIPFKDLYVAMESSYIASKYYARPQIISHNAGLMKLCANIYTEMVRRLLSRDYSLVTDEILQSQVLYSVSRFFIERVWSLESVDAANNYAMAIAGGNTIDTQVIKDQYTNAKIMTIEDLIEFLASISPRMKDLAKKFFIERWMNTFGTTAVLAMDCLPYFIFLMSCTLLGSFLIKQPVMSDIVKNSRGINPSSFYPELTRSVM